MADRRRGRAIEKGEMTDWSRLPEDLLKTIAERLIVDLADYVRARAVCVPWRSAIPDPRGRTVPPQPPWLMLGVDESRGIIHSFSPADGKIHSLELPKTGGKAIALSCDGWLVFFDQSCALSLFNPLTRAEIHLPPLPPSLRFDPQYFKYLGGDRRESFSRKWVAQLVMSSDPMSTPDYTIMAYFGWDCKLLSLRAGATAWTVVDRSTWYTDLTHYNGKFYGIDKFRRVKVFNGHIMATTIESNIDISCHALWQFAESAGQLLVARKVCGNSPIGRKGGKTGPPIFRTERIEVFRLNLSGQPSVVEVKSLGDQILFFGMTRSVSLSASNFTCCRRNVICYGADISFDKGKLSQSDSGVFNLEDGSVEPLPYSWAKIKLLSWHSMWHTLTLS